MSTNLLNELNAFRAAEGKAPFADWRKGRHQPMLDAYLAQREADDAEHDAKLDRQEREMQDELNEEADARGEEPAAEKKALPTYKEMQGFAASVVQKPVALVHEFLNEKGDKLSRKEAVAALIAMGINYSTARTQYQRWYTAKKGK